MDVLRLGLLFSTVGAYGALSRDCRDGADLAVAHLREDGGLPFDLVPVFGDPAGSADRYATLASAMMRKGCRHIVGTITSQSRKDVIPVVEKHDGQLWYVCPYEGFEANENVIYTGACPNQHLVPLFDYLLPRYGARVYLAGANYVWGWEMNRLAREIVTEAGGTIVGERCLPIEETDVGRLVADIEARQPDFILSNLIGPSSQAFLRAMHDLAARDPRFAAHLCPIVSCDLTECELGDIGIGVADGHLAAASYFHNVDTAENRVFKARVAARYGDERRISSFFATSYATVRLCVEAILRSGSDDPRAVREALRSVTFASALGPLTIDPATNHAALPFLLGRIAGRGFDIFQTRPSLAADPYLVARRSTPQPSRHGKPTLRIVS
ncbi:transporter substrate-binding protein [Lichenihabitans sp. PAMC28606]|uniref:transporter substrate-binding protein n=1 Tax=Lichenihabitans sp. PAMC28606 TaxID=2880932 RepID=UPI001D0B51AE|nr:transporter substrate-binding protein [Lichenihabitans sp. PAMC28606]UDL94021.1 transporter substrate-binding protein [Lichenihabitans sp. PAMC28606]